MPVRRLVAPFVSAVVLFAAGCNRPAPAGPASGSAAGGPVSVKVTKPARQTLRWTVEQPGTVAAFESTPVMAKLSGYVKEFAPDPVARMNPATPDAVIDMGSRVKAGQLLATLDMPELEAEAAQKRAAVDQAKSELEQVKKDVAVADAQVAAGRTLVTEAEAGVTKAGAEFARWKEELAQADALIAQKAIDAQSRAVVQKQFQASEAAKAEAEARVGSAKAVLGERQARRAKADADVETAAARVRVADAAVKEVEARLGYARITAPFDGIVTARNVDTRHFVQPPTGGQTKPLFTVARLDVVRVFVDVPEAAAAKAVPGAKAVVRVPSLGNAEFAGTVTRTAGVVQPDTRSLRTEIDLPNDRRILTPGTYVVVRIDAESAGATVLPAACVLPADETHYVFLVEGDKAVKYRVRIGRTEGTTVQVLDRRRATATAGDWEPFTGTERVVVGNLGALADGTQVEVKE